MTLLESRSRALKQAEVHLADFDLASQRALERRTASACRTGRREDRARPDPRRSAAAAVQPRNSCQQRASFIPRLRSACGRLGVVDVGEDAGVVDVEEFGFGGVGAHDVARRASRPASARNSGNQVAREPDRMAAAAAGIAARGAAARMRGRAARRASRASRRDDPPA